MLTIQDCPKHIHIFFDISSLGRLRQTCWFFYNDYDKTSYVWYRHWKSLVSLSRPPMIGEFAYYVPSLSVAHNPRNTKYDNTCDYFTKCFVIIFNSIQNEIDHIYLPRLEELYLKTRDHIYLLELQRELKILQVGCNQNFAPYYKQIIDKLEKERENTSDSARYNEMCRFIMKFREKFPNPLFDGRFELL